MSLGDVRSLVNEPKLFQWLRWRLLRNQLQLIRERGQARVITIFLCSLLIWGGLFAVSYLGFREVKLKYDIALDGRVICLIFDLMFGSLTVLLLFSTAIILYSSLFSSAEATYLLSTPARDDQVFAYKFQGAVAFSSWAFVLLGSPILIGYGLVVGDGAPWFFYAVLPLFFLGFVLLPGSLGALICLLLVNFVPRHRRQVVLGVIVLVIAGVATWTYSLFRSSSQFEFGMRDWMNQLIGGLGVFHNPWMPAHWIAQGLQSAAIDQPATMAYYLALVWSNGLFLYVLTAWAAKKLYRRGYNRVVTGGTLRRRYGGQWLDNLLGRLLFFLDPQTRLLIIKDFRTFRRDPAQWAQIVIFLGLAVLYFYNIRSFYEQDIGRTFRNGISLLNLAATGFLMCAYTGRFIFPMLSLEGRKFWILGLLPMQRDRLLWGKFAFSATGALLVSEFLVVFSNLMLNMPAHMIGIHAATIAVVAFGLSGLSVGIGACIPNFRETDPSKIAVGFGGTLNLVAGLLLLVVVIGLMAGPWHLALALETPLEARSVSAIPWWVWAGSGLGYLAGAAATVFPLRAGARALRGMEF